MSLYVQLFALFLSLLLAVPGAFAEQVDGLYKVSVPISSQSSRQLEQASKAGLKTVFIRVSGNADTVRQPEISQAIARARHYTRQFRYDSRFDQDTETEQMYVELEFEPTLVDRKLRQAGLSVWSANRPTVLVWVVVQDQQGRRFASEEKDPLIVQAINEHATRRGLALKLPTLDLKDMLALSPDQLWKLDRSRIKSATLRYQPDSVLLGRMSLLSNGINWLGSWQYQVNGENYTFDGDEDNIDGYIASSIDQVAELLASRYAVAPVSMAEGGVLMRLSGVSNFVDYARAIRYLEGVSAIQHANVVHISGDEIIVRLVADGLLPQLEQAFALDKRLLPGSKADYQGDYPVVLNYRWSSTAQADAKS